jgi:hypothetical protein
VTEHQKLVAMYKAQIKKSMIHKNKRKSAECQRIINVLHYYTKNVWHNV